MLAGNDPAIQLGQVLFWKDKFLDRAVATRIGERSSHRVLRAHGSGASRKETTLLAGAASAAEWRAWADQPANLVEGKNSPTCSRRPAPRGMCITPATATA
jgi:hypothetical protein